MRFTLATKVSLAIAGVLAVAMLSSVINLVLVSRSNQLMQSVMEDNVASMQAAEGLWAALLEQRGYTSLFLLDEGNPIWLSKLGEQAPAFDRWYEQARSAASSPEEFEILDALNEAQSQYAQDRQEVVSLFNAGDVDAARSLQIDEVQASFERVYQLSKRLTDLNERRLDASKQSVYEQRQIINTNIILSTVLTVVLGIALLWLFFHQLFYPLRRITADVQQFTQTDNVRPTDELELIGSQLRSLMSEVAATRSDLEQSRAQMLLTEKLASVGKLAASVAHEIRNPLTSMRMLMYSVRQDIEHDPSVDRRLDVMTGEITRLESIVRSFLEFSRPPELRPVQVSVSSLLDQTLELFYYRIGDRQIELIRDDAPDLPAIMADPDQVKQIFINLLDNAVEMMPGGGQVCISTRAEPDAQGKPTVVFRFADSGPGMSEEVRERIFEPFFTGRASGTGLGLPIAAAIVARHYGRLILESTGPEGTVFAVIFPAVRTDNNGQSAGH